MVPEIDIAFGSNQLVELGLMQKTGERKLQAKRFKQHMWTGAEILETIDWPGKYIPINIGRYIPV